MPQESLTKNLSNFKASQFHQIGNRQGQERKCSPSKQRVLILSTPIKSKDGTVNMEQRTIPLRIDNGQLTITATENNNKIVSLKRSIEAPALALPINQLNKKSPTFVKNEVGQVMGKLIPLGKFSDITRNNLAPISPVPSSLAAAATGGQSLKLKVSDLRGKKLLKLDEKLETMKSNERIIADASLDAEARETAIAVSAIVPKVENITEQLITITDAKPKKRVHLVLKGCKNMASIGQTGTKIKLIPLDHWKLDGKSNILKTPSTSGSTISQPKIVDVRSCTLDEMNGSEDLHPDGNELHCSYEKVHFDIDNILEKDPLDIGEMLSEETETLARSLEGNLSKNDLDLKRESKLPKQYRGMSKPDSIRTVSESGRLNTSKILTLAKGGMNVELRFENKLKTQSFWAKQNNVLSKNSSVESKSSEADADNVEKLDLVVNNSSENVAEASERRKIDVNYTDLYKRFGINKDNITQTETAMLSYICNLKKKLSQSQKSRVQALTALQPREYLGNNNLSNIQKRFVESQLRNSGRMKKKPRFMKTDLVMARDILKATGPRGYSNLRKLFSLPDMSAVVKAIS